MGKSDDEKPYCFGKLENVFPLSEDGLRHSPESCMVCIYKTDCLKTAIQTKDGVKVKQEALDRAYSSGRMSFLTRWSKKKTLQKKKKDRSCS